MALPPPPSKAASSLLPIIRASPLPQAEEHQASDGVTSVPQLHAANAALPALGTPPDANEAPLGLSGALLPAIGPPPGLSRPLPTPLEPALNQHAPPLAAQKPLRGRNRASAAQAAHSSAAQSSAAHSTAAHSSAAQPAPPIRQLTGEDFQRNPPTMRRLAQRCATLPPGYHFMHKEGDSEEEEDPAVEERDAFFDRDWNHGMFFELYGDGAQQQRSDPPPGLAPITTAATAVVNPVPTDTVRSTAVLVSTTAEPGSSIAGTNAHRHRRRHNSARGQAHSSAPAVAVQSPAQGYPGAPHATIGAASQAVSHWRDSAHGLTDRTASAVSTHTASQSGIVRKVAPVSQDARLDPAFCQQQGWTDAGYGYAVGRGHPPGPSGQQSLRSGPGAQAFEGGCNSKSAVQQHEHRRQPGGESGRLAAYRPDVRQADRTGRSYNRANEPQRAIVANSSATASHCSHAKSSGGAAVDGWNADDRGTNEWRAHA